MRRMLVVAAATTLSLVAAAPAGADLTSDLAEVERRIEELDAAIEDAEGVRTDAAAEVLETSEHLAVITDELRTAETALAATEQEIALTENTLTDLLDRISERELLIGRIQATVDEERDLALERAVEVYMAAHADVTARFIGSDDSSAGVGIVYAERVQGIADEVIDEYELSRYRQQQEVARLAAERLAAEEHKLVLEAQEIEREAAAAEVAVRFAEVETTLAAQQALLDEIDHEIAHIEGEIDSLEREQSDIEALIEQEQSRGGSAPGSLVRPVPGGVSSGFGWRIHPIYGDARLHTGWDMNGSCGVPIRAAASGRVFYTGWKGGYGNAVMIDHGGGLSTLYAHQSSIGVSYGEQVAAGEVIGWVGTTGTSTACHLHFETRVSGTPVDPIAYLSP